MIFAMISFDLARNNKKKFPFITIDQFIHKFFGWNTMISDQTDYDKYTFLSTDRYKCPKLKL